MKRFLAPTFLIFAVPIFSGADYYISDYDPDYVPYNLEEAIDSREYDSCVEDLREFDETYQQYVELYGTPVSVGDTLDLQFGALKEVYEEEFRRCLASVRDEIREESILYCDFEVIEALNREQERQYRNEIRMCKNLRAVENCDFSYIEEMGGVERFEFRTQIKECEAAQEPEISEELPTEEQATQPAPVKDLEIESEPTEATDTEAIAAPASPTIPDPTPPQPPTLNSNSEPVPEIISPAEEGSSKPVSSSSDAEVIVMSQDELDDLVAERVAEESRSKEHSAQEENVPDERSGFLKRMWSFIFGWI